MKVTLAEEKVFNKKQIAIYITIIVICIISIIIAFYVQFYARIDFKRMIGIETKTEFGTKSQEQIEMLKEEFEQIFTNGIEESEDQTSKKKEPHKALVYTKTERRESKLNNYEIDVHIPYINIDSPIIEKYNQEIQSFEQKANSVIEKQGKNTIYTVEYVANVQKGILSLIIRSNLKEGNNAQRVIVETFNYDLRNNKEISLEEILRIENLDKEQTMQNQKRNCFRTKKSRGFKKFRLYHL